MNLYLSTVKLLKLFHKIYEITNLSRAEVHEKLTIIVLGFGVLNNGWGRGGKSFFFKPEQSNFRWMHADPPAFNHVCTEFGVSPVNDVVNTSYLLFNNVSADWYKIEVLLHYLSNDVSRKN